MPFSLSHAGFVAPLRRFLLPHHLFALMVGSVAPDFGYYVRWYGLSDYSHTLAGAFVACLPLGLLAYLFGLLCLRHTACLLPEPHRGILKDSNLTILPRAGRVVGLAIAVLIGALLHNFVDSFTHETGVAVSRSPFLKTEALSLGGEPFPVYRLLQYGGSALGVVMLLTAYGFVLRRYCGANTCPLWQDRDRWWTLNWIAIVSAALAAIPHLRLFREKPLVGATRDFAFQFLTTWPPLLIGLLIIVAAFRRRAA